jgi:signal transduction histidine kinase
MILERGWGRSIRGLVAVICTVFNGPADAQHAWYREQFMSENGLLQNRVHAMVRDPWGALLIGTEGGLVRYDGHHFRQLGISAPEGMRPSRVLDILPTNDGAFVIRDAGCRQFVIRNDKLDGVTMDAPARPYLSRFAGGMVSASIALRAMDPDSLFPGKTEWPSIVRPVTLADGRWCMRSDSVLLVYRGDELVVRMPLPFGRSSHLFTLESTLYTMDRNGQVLSIDVDGRSYRGVGLEGLDLTLSSNTSAGFRLFWDPQEGLATLLVDKVLYLLERSSEGVLKAVRLNVELPRDAKVGGLVWLDGKNAFAVGTDTKGLFIYRRNSMISLLCESSGDGVNNAYNTQAPIGRSGVLTANRVGARVFTLNGCETRAIPIERFNDLAILLDKEQRYWYGRGDTLYAYDAVLDEERIVRVGLRPLCFLEEADRLWVGAGTGVFQIAQGGVKLVHPISEGDLSLRPLSLCRTPEGEFWMATCSGVFRIAAGGGWEVVPGLEQVCARELSVIDGAVFVGTYGSGAFMAKAGTVYRLPMDDQEFLSHVHAFMPDGAGYLWMSTNQGLFRTRLNDLYAWIKEQDQRVYYAYYGKQAGIVNAEFNGGCSPAYVRTMDGWASFPTMDGLVWFKPEEVPDAYPDAGFMLEGVQVDGEDWDLAKPLHWSHQEVVVKLSLAYWGSPENVRLEYSFDDDERARWLQLSPGQREIRLGSIAPGNRTLRVRKVGARLRDDTQHIALVFDVPAPYYKRPWFVLGSVLLVAMLFLGVVRLNAVRLRRRNLQLERMVSERTGELVKTNEVLRRSLEMKEMLVSIISHDIVTPLRFLARVSEGSVRRLSEPVDPILAATLSDVARSSNKLFANAQDLLQWIKRQDGRIELRVRNCLVNQLVEEVLDRERERALDKQVRLINAVPVEHVVRTDRNVLSIILHNALANAVTHTHKGSVSVTAEVRHDTYHISVRDTGEGIPPAVLEHAKRVQNKGALGAMNSDGERDVQGLGLLIIADLLDLLGGRFTITSELAKGTTVTLIIPIDVPGNVRN